jgi:hypothetical protein
MFEFAKVQQGEQAGKLVPVLQVNPSINLIDDKKAPHNPYRTGYGQRIPTSYRVRVFDQRWRRVYVVQYSNAGTAYILYKNEAFRVSW